MSLDGRTAMASGESRWITGEAARLDVHRLRARSSAIITGIGTVLADDPELTARLPDHQAVIEQPTRIILDSKGRCPSQLKMGQGPGRKVVLTTFNTLKDETPEGFEIVLGLRMGWILFRLIVLFLLIISIYMTKYTLMIAFTFIIACNTASSDKNNIEKSTIKVDSKNDIGKKISDNKDNTF